MKTALVTGATGFVGSHIARVLVERGINVRALVRATSNTAALEALPGDLVELVRGDLTVPASLEGICDGVDAVLHSACAVKGTFDASDHALDDFLRVNRDGTMNLAREVAKREGLRLVHVSSTAAMGTPVSVHIDEQSPCNPVAPYQVSKREAELALLEMAKEGLDVVMLRPCVVAGPGKAGGELLKLFRMVRKGRLPYIGRNYDVEKPMIMIDDLVEAVILAADAGRSGEIYFIHSDGHHTMGEIIAAAGRVTGAKRTHFVVPVPAARLIAHGFRVVSRFKPDWNPPLTPERIDLFLADRKIDISKARRELGYNPKHQNLDEMLGSTHRWYLSQGDL